MRAWIDRFDPEVSLKSLSNTPLTYLHTSRIPFVEVCTAPSSTAVPVLEEELKKNNGEKRLRIALALAMHGSENGASVIYQEIEAQIIDGALPELKEEVKWSGGGDKAPPDQGAAPKCANLIYALAMTRSDLNISAAELVAGAFRADCYDDFHAKYQSLFYYIDAVAYAADLVGSKSSSPI